MRARRPDREGFAERDGVRLGFEVFGDGEPTVLLLPTWTIIHSRFWKLQVPYLARRYRVITYDGPGNGRSDRVTDPSRYGAAASAADAVAVLDACAVDRAVVVGLSLGGAHALRLAAVAPERTLGAVLVGAALPLAPPLPERAGIADHFRRPYPEDADGWDRYNLAYWHDHYPEFVEFFFAQCFSEPHSTKPREDAVGWALETGPDVLEAAEGPPGSEPLSGEELFEGVTCPLLFVHGDDDHLTSIGASERAAAITGGELVVMEGAGHIPLARDPVRFNLIVQDFVERLAS
jgi:pimeloyl-ACP methyl ester carboxylesterase